MVLYPIPARAVPRWPVRTEKKLEIPLQGVKPQAPIILVSPPPPAPLDSHPFAMPDSSPFPPPVSGGIKITTPVVSLFMARYRFLLSGVPLFLLVSTMPAKIRAQELPWLRAGQVRLDVAPSFWAWDSRFGMEVGPSGSIVETTEPLGLELDRQPLGSAPIPYLQDLEANLRDALQDQSFAVKLGDGHSIVEQSRLTLPLRLDLGVTDWLTLGAMVPFHRPRTEMDFFLDPDSANANVGLSPQLTNAAQVSQFVSAFQAVLDAGQEAAPNHPALLEARGYLMALGAAYSQASLFPVAGSEAGAELQARLDALRAELEAQGFTGVPGEVPLAGAYLNAEDFNSFLASRGMQAYPLEDWTHLWTLGDVELTVQARVLHHGFEADSSGARPKLRYQAGIGALVRLGTGSQADPNRFFDLDPADGQMDFEGSVFGLVEFGRWLGAWGRARYGVQQEGTVIRRIARPSQVLPEVYRRAPLNWTPGHYLDVEVNPRFYLTPEMTFGVRYHLWHKGYDTYTLGAIDPEVLQFLNLPSPSWLELETQQVLHEVAVSATYSTVAANRRGESSMPLLVRAVYYHPVAGSGGQTPKGGRLQIGLSLYRSLWGGNPQTEVPEGPQGR